MYTTRVGTRRRMRPAGDHYRIPSLYRRDDGHVVYHVGDWDAVCSDCGRGRLRWAEAGYVPWHRICDVCGSHWDLHPVQFFLVRFGVSWETPSYAIEVPEMEHGQEHVMVLSEMIERRHMDAAVKRAEGTSGVPVIDACWAKRARFYRR